MGDKKGFIIIWDWRYFIFIGILIFIFFIWDHYFACENPLDYFGENKKIRIYGEANPNFLYWNSISISYKFSIEYPCFDGRKSRVIQAFNIIEKETENIISFVEDPENGEIEIKCFLELETESASGFGGPEYYEGDREIIEGEIGLYIPDPINFIQCESYPVVEMHEILHVFGFDHIYNEESIMYPGGDNPNYEWESCVEIDREIVECLKNIYSNGVNGTFCEGLPTLF